MGSSEVVAPVCHVCGERPARKNGRRGGAPSFRRACSFCERSARESAVVAEVDQGIDALIEGHEQEVAALRLQAAEDRQEVLLLKRTLREAEEQSNSLRIDVKSLRLDLDGAKAALVEAALRQEALERARARADESARLERTAALQADAQRNELRARVQEVEPLRGELSRLQMEIEQAQAERDGLREEVARLLAALEKSEQDRSELSVALKLGTSSSTAERNKFEADRDASKKEIEALRWEVTQANAASADLESALQGETSKTGDLQLERDDLKRRLLLAEDERSALRVDKRRALSSSAELQKDVDNLSKRLHEAQRAGRAFMFYGVALTAVVAFTCIYWLTQLT